MRRAKILVMTLVVLALAGGVWGQELKLPPGKWWENPQLVERINLTPEQQDNIRKLVYQHAQRMIDLNAEVRHRQLELNDLVDRSTLNASEVRAAFAAFQKARADLERERFELLLSVRQVLTDRQWNALRRMKKERPTMRERIRERALDRRNRTRRDLPPPPAPRR